MCHSFYQFFLYLVFIQAILSLKDSYILLLVVWLALFTLSYCKHLHLLPSTFCSALLLAFIYFCSAFYPVDFIFVVQITADNFVHLFTTSCYIDLLLALFALLPFILPLAYFILSAAAIFGYVFFLFLFLSSLSCKERKVYFKLYNSMHEIEF